MTTVHNCQLQFRIRFFSVKIVVVASGKLKSTITMNTSVQYWIHMSYLGLVLGENSYFSYSIVYCSSRLGSTLLSISLLSKVTCWHTKY